MSLDLVATMDQLDILARRLDGDRDDWSQRLGRAITALMEADASEVRRKAESTQGRPYLYAGMVEDPAGRYGPPELPLDFCVASVDGSHIDVDRHIPVRCYLINVGGCLLTYGSRPDALLFSHPTLYAEEKDLYIDRTGPESRETVPVEGALVGLKRSVAEVVGLAALVRDAPPELPTLALVDGSLIMWGLAGRGYQPLVREELLVRGLIPALDSLRDLARGRTLAVAAYTSLPQSREVVNALRLFLCTYDSAECARNCSSHRSTRAPCDIVNGFLDRHLFQNLLDPGERSSVFRTNSSISREFYGPHQVYFYYLNTGEEIARIEVPEWVARDEVTLPLTHGLVMDQCRRGVGYPAAIAEAHEQAVVNGADRESFKQLLEDALGRKGLPVYTSEKARSKRMRWL